MERSLQGIFVMGGRPEDAPLMKFHCKKCDLWRTVSRDVYEKEQLPDKAWWKFWE
jgi:hypothetical protein